MSSAVLTRVGARLPASAPSALLRMPKRFAGAEYAGMKVKKNNWVEQNEILRENQFYNWRIHKGNIAGLLFMVFAFPLGYRHLYKQEMELRDQAEGLPVRERM